MNTLLRRTLLLTAAVVPLSAGFASAQYRIDNGAARDANNRVGSGGYNDARNDAIINNRIGGLAGNYIVTGNVTGGRAFRGNIDYTNQYAFRGNLGSSDIDPFIRDSTGVAEIRGNYGNNARDNQLFFGNRTVAPPPGFVRSQIDNGQFERAQPSAVLPNDTRIDYGGATRADVTQSLINNRQQYGNAGLAPTSGIQWTGPQQDDNGQLQLSEYTTLARQRRDIFAGVDPTQRADQTNDNNNLTDFTGSSIAPANQNAQPAARPAQQDDQNATTPDNRLDRSSPIQAQPDANNPALPGDTGQAMSRRSSRAVDNNAQYAKLRDRLAQVRGTQRDTNNDNRTAGSVPIGQPIGATGAASTGQGRVTTPVARTNGDTAEATNDAKPDATPNGATPADAATPGTATPGNAAATPGRTDTRRPTPAAQPKRPTASDIGAPTQAQTPDDNLQLPRPGGQPDTAKHPATPVVISSFATGVKDPKLAKMLTQAETLMKSGKFGSAIDQFDRAEEIASDDPLVFMGRSIAELGGGYYRKAETHLRQAFAADESLLYAKFDLRGMLGDDRLNTLAGNLSEIAGKNERDAGPLLLLAFIYYNGGMEDRAARALDMAQVRAGGKDKDIEALRKNWSFDSAPAGAAGDADQNK